MQSSICEVRFHFCVCAMKLQFPSHPIYYPFHIQPPYSDPADPLTVTETTRYVGLVVARGPVVTVIGPEDGFTEIENRELLLFIGFEVISRHINPTTPQPIPLLYSFSRRSGRIK
jgi:hypothetical protein